MIFRSVTLDKWKYGEEDIFNKHKNEEEELDQECGMVSVFLLISFVRIGTLRILLKWCYLDIHQATGNYIEH